MATESLPSKRLWVPLALCTALFALLIAAAAWRYRPSPVDSNASEKEFSAMRAYDMFRKVFRLQTPHPVGSYTNFRAANHLVEQIKQLGYKPRLHRGFACGIRFACATVNNILVEIPGHDPDNAVMAAAHYDSAPVAPGAADDGAGVAALLEILRALKHRDKPKRSIIMLFDDGEEGGLNGARAFVDEHPWAKRVRYVVNLEARGTSGPSLMFETTVGNKQLIDLFARVSPRPITSSAFYDVYRQMPNETDLSVFRELDISGFGLAFVGDASNYHTPRDAVAQLDLRSLQHQGETALALVSELAFGEAPTKTTKDAIFFDVFSLTVARYGPVVAWSCIALSLLLFVVLVRRRDPGVRVVARGLLGAVATVLIACLLSAAFAALLWWLGAITSPWIAQPAPMAALSVFCAMIALLVGASIARARPGCLRWGFATLWLIAAVLTTAFAPGFSYLFCWPALGALAVLALPRCATGHACASAVVMLCLGIVWVPILWLLYDGIGYLVPPIYATLIAIVASPIADVLSDLQRRGRHRGFAFAGINALGCAIVCLVIAPQSVTVPSRATVRFHQPHGGQARVLLRAQFSRIPAAMRKAIGGEDLDVQPPFPWSLPRDYALIQPATSLPVPPPILKTLSTKLRDGRRVVRALFKSQRRARVMKIMTPPNARITGVMFDDQLRKPNPRKLKDGRRVYGFLTVPNYGIKLELELPRNKVELLLYDFGPGVAAPGHAVLISRPPWAQPSHFGDGTIATHTVKF